MSTNTSATLASRSLNSAADKVERLRRAARKGLTPPPRISVPDWADRFRYLAPGAGSTIGKWKTSKVEIARGPMLAVTEPGVEIITARTCTQLLKTSLIENVFGYFAHLDPCPMLLLQPKDDAAQQFSKERIAPMIRVTPVLRELVGSRKTRDADETLLYKAFPGGFLALAGAGSPDNVARRPIKVLFCDEVDKYVPTKEGPVIPLAEERLGTFIGTLSIRASSPTLEDESEIDASYQQSDQRLASVECPHCRHRQFPDFFGNVDWEKEGDRHRAETALIHCEACQKPWVEGRRIQALQTIRWHQMRPFECCGERQVPAEAYGQQWRAGNRAAVETIWDWWHGPRHAVYRARCQHCGAWPVSNRHAGFTASKLYSPWPRDATPRIAQKWLDAKGDPSLEQSFWNTQMGKVYRLRAGKDVAAEALLARAENWDAPVPDGVAILTAGVDVQDDRLEVEVVGWGRGEESWSVHHEVLEGDPETGELWARLDSFLMQRWQRADGRPFAISAACIDTGGHHTEKVYQFAKNRLGRRIWAIKGESAKNGERNPIWPLKRPTAKSKSKFRPVIIGVNAAKDVIRNRLAMERHGPGFMHYPADRGLNWFMQLTAERLKLKVISGKRVRIWEQIKGRANEALDMRVYAYAALMGLVHLGWKLNALAEEIGAQSWRPPEEVPAEAVVAAREVEAPARGQAGRQGSWFSGRTGRPGGFFGRR